MLAPKTVSEMTQLLR